MGDVPYYKCAVLLLKLKCLEEPGGGQGFGEGDPVDGIGAGVHREDGFDELVEIGFCVLPEEVADRRFERCMLWRIGESDELVFEIDEFLREAEVADRGNKGCGVFE